MTSSRQLVQDLYDALARGDATAAFGVFDPAIRWMEAEGVPYADRNPYVGPQQVGEGVFGRLMTEFTGFSVHPALIVGDGDEVVALGRYRATCAATGRALDAQFAHHWTVREGKITAFQQYTDTAQWNAVMSRAAVDAAAAAHPAPLQAGFQTTPLMS